VDVIGCFVVPLRLSRMEVRFVWVADVLISALLQHHSDFLNFRIVGYYAQYLDRKFFLGGIDYFSYLVDCLKHKLRVQRGIIRLPS
jgi:hypothetical protein